MTQEKKTDFFRQTLTLHRKYIYLALFVSIFVAILPVLPIVYMRTVFGPVLNSQSLSFLLALAFLLVLGLAINGFLEWVRERVLLSGTVSFVNTLETKIFSSTFEQSIDRWNSGSRCFTNLRILRNFMVSPIAGAFFDAPFSLIFLIAIFLIHPLMGFFSLFGLFMALVVGLLIERKVQPQQESAGRVQSKARNELNQLHNNALYCNSMGNLPYLFDKWITTQKQFLVHQGAASSMQSLGSSVTQVVMMVQGSMLLGVGTLLMLLGLMDKSMAGNLIVAKFIGALAIRPTMMIVMGWTTVIGAREAVKELTEFLETTTEKKESGIKLPPPKGNLVVSDVTFQQDERSRKILDNLSFSLKPGNICAVLGESGAGKSTLARLLVGYMAPSRGNIRLDGVAIHTWNKKDLCDHIGYLPQDMQLFGGEAFDNITRFKPVDLEEFERVCKEFEIYEIFDAFKNDESFEISDDLYDLPGGFKQKIALARAFYNSPNFIVLDEPTSSLDAGFENKFLEILNNYKKRGALILINTHNKSILKMADYILALQEGRQKLFDTKENIKKKMNLPL